MKLLAFFLLQELHQKLDNKRYFSRRKILETPVFLDLFSERRFRLYSSFFILSTTKVTMRPLAVPKDCINSNPY
jgi:hypothetical protein